MKRIQIKNVRSLKDTGDVTLTPITVLVGENSSGKSTFLRTFPLIKQSICKRTDGPLLWAGDVDDYVDFGSFEETVSKDAYPKIISFQFSFALNNAQPDVDQDYFSYDFLLESADPDVSDEIVYSISISKKDTTEYISELSVKICNTSFKFKFGQSNQNIFIDGKEFKLSDSLQDSSSFAYYMGGAYTSNESIFGFRLPDFSGTVNDLLDRVFVTKSRTKNNKDTFLHFHRIYSATALQLIGDYLCRGFTLSQITSKKADMPDNTTQSVRSAISKISGLSSEDAQWCTDACKLYFFYRRFAQIDRYLDVYFRQIHYIAPLRATAERYYRLRNLAIDEVDYQGKNLPVFLNGLSATRLSEFQDWTQKHFGFRVLVKKEGGHLSVRIALQNGASSINMSDTGFGYSQILPIITQLWHLSTKDSREPTSIPLVIAIEQPELHLHPALQAKLTDAFIASISLAKEHNHQLQLILETHSETIVNRLGYAIAKGKLKPDDVSVLLFSKDKNTNNTVASTSSFDDAGYLCNWPNGLFSPEVE